MRSGPLSLLPILLAGLGAVFTAAGVGEVISGMVSSVIPEGNMVVGIIVYAVGMAVFTMVMGNAFAAITVMTVGVGAPFVLALGADPVVVGSVALTCGYCGTLCTPMAANFNMVSVAILDMKDKNGVIKKQIPIALVMLAVQIVYMIAMAYEMRPPHERLRRPVMDVQARCAMPRTFEGKDGRHEDSRHWVRTLRWSDYQPRTGGGEAPARDGGGRRGRQG